MCELHQPVPPRGGRRLIDPEELQERWVLRTLVPEDLPVWCAERLAQGDDGPVLREVAGWHRPGWADVDGCWSELATDLGLAVLPAEQARRNVTRRMAAKIVAGDIDVVAGAAAVVGLWEPWWGPFATHLDAWRDGWNDRPAIEWDLIREAVELLATVSSDPVDLAALSDAIRAGWSPDTAFASEAYLSRGQCGATALVVQDWLGGDLLVGEFTVGGGRMGVHYRNRLPDGREVDLTEAQLLTDEVLGPARVVTRGDPTGAAGRAYAGLAKRVRRRLVQGR